MKGNLPCRTRSRHQQHDGQRYAGEPICDQIQVRHGAEQSQDEHASAEYKHMRREVTRHHAHYRSEGRPDETMPGNGARRTQR